MRETERQQWRGHQEAKGTGSEYGERDTEGRVPFPWEKGEHARVATLIGALGAGGTSFLRGISGVWDYECAGLGCRN